MSPKEEFSNTIHKGYHTRLLDTWPRTALVDVRVNVLAVHIIFF